MFKKSDKYCGQRVSYLISTGFGLGLVPVMPGTVGSLIALPLWWVLTGYSWLIYAASILLATIVGIYVCGQTAVKLGNLDPKIVVWDEIVGMLITLSILSRQQWRWVFCGFLLFRALDICKPWPINYIDQKIHGGVGIMLDDIIAALLAALCLWLFGHIV